MCFNSVMSAVMAATLLSFAGSSNGQQRLWTAPWGNGSSLDGAGIFVDLTARSENRVVTEIGFTFSSPGVPVRLRVWQRDGSYQGFDGSSDGWVVVDQIDVTSFSRDNPTPVVLNNPISLSVGEATGFLFEAEVGGALWTGTPNQPPQTQWADDHLRLFSDVARDAPFAGNRFHPRCFAGYIAYETAPELGLFGDCPGPITVEVAGATSGGYVALAYAFGTGLHQIPPGRPCAGVTLGLDDSARLIGRRVADENGEVTVTLNAPPAACDRVFIQAIDLERCALTNVVSL